MHLIAPAAEFRGGVPGEKFRPAAGHIDIAVFPVGKPVQDADKFLQELYLIEQHAVLPAVLNPAQNPWIEHFRVEVFLILREIKRHLDNVIPGNALIQQMILEQSPEQV